MDFDTEFIDKKVDTQDGTGELPEPSYGQQVSNAYNQSNLVDYWSSEHNQYMEQVDETLGSLDIRDDYKESVRFYKDRIVKYEDDLLRNMYDDGDWGYDEKTEHISFNNQKALDLRHLPDYEKKMRGFALSNYHPELEEESLRTLSSERTREKYLGYEKELSQDNFFDNFGSQVLGNVGAYLTDPIGATTIALELATLGALKPITFSLQAAKGLSKAERLLQFTQQTQSAHVAKQVTPGMKKAVFDIHKKKVLKTAGAESAIGGTSEAIQQELTFDFKSSVLPEFDEYQKNLQIGLVAGASGLLVIAGAGISHQLVKTSFEDATARGAKATEEVEEMFKKEDDIVDGVETTPLKEEEDINKIKEQEEFDQSRETFNSAIEEMKACLAKGL